MHQLRGERISRYVEKCQCDRQFETTATGAAGIEVKTITVPLDAGFVRVAGDDEFDLAVEIGRDVGDIVGQQGLPAVDLKGEIVREIGRPGQVEVVGVFLPGPRRISRQKKRQFVFKTVSPDSIAIINGWVLPVCQFGSCPESRQTGRAQDVRCQGWANCVAQPIQEDLSQCTCTGI